MMKTARLITALLALAAVAGCKLNLTADVYSTDLRAVMAGTAGITSPATMAFQVPDVEKCDEHTASIREIMVGVLEDFTPKGCKSESMDSFLLADTQMPIFNTEEAWQKADSLFGLLLVKRPDPVRHPHGGALGRQTRYEARNSGRRIPRGCQGNPPGGGAGRHPDPRNQPTIARYR